MIIDTIDKQVLIDRFIKYTSFDTTSYDSNTDISNQRELLFYLKKELVDIGVKEEYMSCSCDIIYVDIPPIEKNKKSVGFLAHVDTSSSASGSNINPRIVNKYDGKNISLIYETDTKINLNPIKFPELNNYIGQDIIVTDGSTLLGADDKAGIASIITALEYILKNNIDHGRIYLAFTTNEEIGIGVSEFDTNLFHPDYAYTVDGSGLGTIEYETFNAVNATIDISGITVHAGSAKDKMVNSIYVGNEFLSLLPQNKRAESTSNREGFYHVNSFKGSVESTSIHLLLRDHNKDKLNSLKDLLMNIQDFLIEKYKYNMNFNEFSISITFLDKFENMYDKISKDMYSVDKAKEVMKSLDITPVTNPIRGGTDGATITNKYNIPCPNLFAGGENPHSIYEYLPVDNLVKSSLVVLNIMANP